MKKWIQKRSPTVDTVSEKYPILSVFGKSIIRPELWRFRKQPCACGFAIGLFWSMIPMPFQMVPAAFVAILSRANLSIALAACWITNPITLAPIFFLNYRFGVFVFQCNAVSYDRVVKIHNLDTFTDILPELWLPLYGGSLIIGIVFALCGYIATIFSWNFVTMRKRYNRNKRNARQEN